MASGTRVADVVVIGGGNAALCAAISAQQAGARVLVLERAAATSRGGNSKYTRNLRCIRDGLYEEAEFLDDVRGVSDPGTDEDLLRLLIRRSRDLPFWMEKQGVRWQPGLRGSLQLTRTNKFFLGGGKALLNVYYARARALGIAVAYESHVRAIEQVEGGIALTVEHADGATTTTTGAAVVVASGGFEANGNWLRHSYGDRVDRFAVRGSRFNDGEVIRCVHDLGAASSGSRDRAHAIAVDDRSPAYDSGIVSRVDAIPFGIVVNAQAQRFADEGENLWPKRYASWGGLIAGQPGQIAFSIFEARLRGSFVPSLFPPIEADTIPELAGKLGLDPSALTRTVAAFNAATSGLEPPDLGQLDGRSTRGLALPKSNWAVPIATGPFCAYPIRPGITFTYYGLAVDDRARVIDVKDAPMAGLYAAGEAAAGNFLNKGYLAGFGMTIGGVLGRIAGEEAAEHAREQN